MNMEEHRIGLNFATEVESAIADALRNMGLEEGNTVYWVRGKVFVGTIKEVCLGDEECDIKVLDNNKEPTAFNLEHLTKFYIYDFGKEVFFSKEQAEEVLQNPNCINQNKKKK
jgi:hypothetical protein